MIAIALGRVPQSKLISLSPDEVSRFEGKITDLAITKAKIISSYLDQIVGGIDKFEIHVDYDEATNIRCVALIESCARLTEDGVFQEFDSNHDWKPEEGRILTSSGDEFIYFCDDSVS